MKNVNTGIQFASVLPLILLVRKGIITEQEMIDFYSEVSREYSLNRDNYEAIINKLLRK